MTQLSRRTALKAILAAPVMGQLPVPPLTCADAMTVNPYSVNVVIDWYAVGAMVADIENRPRIKEILEAVEERR